MCNSFFENAHFLIQTLRLKKNETFSESHAYLKISHLSLFHEEGPLPVCPQYDFSSYSCISENGTFLTCFSVFCLVQSSSDRSCKYLSAEMDRVFSLAFLSDDGIFVQNSINGLYLCMHAYIMGRVRVQESALRKRQHHTYTHTVYTAHAVCSLSYINITSRP